MPWSIVPAGLSQGTPRTAQASLLTGSENTYQTMAGLHPSSLPSQQLITQNSSHSGVQYAVSPAAHSPANSPRYAISQVLSPPTPHSQLNAALAMLS